MEFEEVMAAVIGEVSPGIVAINHRLNIAEQRVARCEVTTKEQIAKALAAAVGEIEKILTIKFNDMSIQISEDEFRDILDAAMRELV